MAYPVWYDKSEELSSVSFGYETKPTSCEFWFYWTPILQDINFQNIDTSNVTNFAQMFASAGLYSCPTMTVLDTSSGENFSWMFSRVALQKIDVSNFDTKNATNMEGMFDSADAETLNVSSFDTKNVTTMADMFRDCDKLTSLDLSSFDTRSIMYVNTMFGGCKNLKTIYASDSFAVDRSAVGDYRMFYDCTNLKGGGGTVYDSNNIDKTYARIDNPPNEPGYFTLKS